MRFTYILRRLEKLTDKCPFSNQQVKSYAEVPGPKPIPILGNTWRVFPIIGQYRITETDRISAQLYHEYGNIVKLSGLIARPDLLFVYDCDEIENIYRTEGDTPYRPSVPCLVKYKSEVRKDFFGRLAGVVGVHGEPWREFRTIVQKPILQLQTINKHYIEPLVEVTDTFIDRIVSLRNNNNELPDDFDNEIHRWSLECIGRVALDVRLGCLDAVESSELEPQKIIDAAKFALRNVAILELKFPFWRYLPSNLWSKYVSNMDFFRKVLAILSRFHPLGLSRGQGPLVSLSALGVSKGHGAQDIGIGIFEVVIKYIDQAMENLEKKKQTTNNQLSSSDLSIVEWILSSGQDKKIAYVLALDLILVGIDTISMAVCSILYQIATRPEEQEKMYQELKRVLPDPNAQLTRRHLDQMHYVRAFIKEVLRMYSTVIGNGRTLQKDTVICGYHIPKGVQLVFPTLITGQIPKYVSDAHIFKPERWMKTDGGKSYIHPFASLPYGYGPRMCLGRRIADLEMQILLAKLIRKYRLEHLKEPLEYEVTFMYAPKGNLDFKMTPRTD